jgi:hypothetical protein
MALDNFLKRFICKDPKEHNYTKIASQKLNIFGGSFTIPSSDVDDFYRVYTKHVFEERKQAYLTEKQPDEGPILIDLDFRYDSSIEERQHTKDHIVDFIQLVLENINKIVENNGKPIMCFVFEKDNVNMQDTLTKDGIHIMIHLKMDYVMKLILRKALVDEIGEIWGDIPITNTWSDVLDEKVFEGHANWQLFGSRKPGNEDYKLACMCQCNYVSGDDNTWNIKEEKIKDAFINNFSLGLRKSTIYLIFVPKGSIKQNFTLDAQ